MICRVGMYLLLILEISACVTQKKPANVGHFDVPKKTMPVISSESKYSINLMWINKAKNPQQIFVDNSKNIADFHHNSMFKWAELNPRAIINFWYDGSLLSPEVIERTRQEIHQLRSRHNLSATIQLQDVRQIPLVQNNEVLFTQYMSVYYRADLLRMMAGVYTLAQNIDYPVFIYADLDIVPMDENQLFDSDTIAMLNYFGIVLPKIQDSFKKFENSFFMLSNDSNATTAVQRITIDLSITRGYACLRGEIKYPPRAIDASEVTFPEVVYAGLFVQFLPYLSYLSQRCQIYVTEGKSLKKNKFESILNQIKATSDQGLRDRILADNNIRIYEWARDGLKPFGEKKLHRNGDGWRSLPTLDVDVSDIDDEDCQYPAPIKDVVATVPVAGVYPGGCELPPPAGE